MQRTLRWVCPLVALAVFGTLCTADTKKKTEATNKKTEPKKTDTKKRLRTSIKLTGKLTAVENSSKNFTLQVTLPDPAKYQQLQQYIAQQQLEISRMTKLVDRQRRLLHVQAEVAKRQRDLLTHGIKKDVQLTAEEGMKVRQKTLPPDYDDKGKPKKYTAKERKELKGPDKDLPGYTADWENLHKDQYVEVYLTKQKPPRAKAKGKDKDADKVEDLGDDRLKVWLVMILGEPMDKK